MAYKLEHGSEADLRIADFMIAWLNFEKTPKGRGVEFSDFNISQHDTKKAFDDYADVKAELSSILDLEEVQNCPRTVGKLNAFWSVLKDIENGATSHMPTYLYETMGFQLSLVPPQEIEAAYRDLIEKADAVGIDFGKQSANFNQLLGEMPIEEAKSFIDNQLKKACDKAEAITGIPLNFNVDVLTRPNDGSWRSSIGGSGRDFFVEFNTKIIESINKPTLKSLVYHELAGHGAQYSYIADKVESGEWPIHGGITSMIDEAVYQAEMLAQGLPYFFDDGTDPNYSASLAQDYYHILCNQNATYIFQHEGAEASLDYMREIMPYRQKEFFDRRIAGLSQDHMNRVYWPIYNPSHRIMHGLIYNHPKADVEGVLKELYLGHYTVHELNELMKSTGLDSKYLVNTDKPRQDTDYSASPVPNF